jgi:serine/threonine protein kinase
VSDFSSETQIRPGFRLDRYELLCPIAEGGMARVWVARQVGKHGFEKLVAVKTILPKFASDLRFQEMFLDEARLASAIQHTNVARILDLGEEHEVLYIVMEWIDGEALNRVQRSLAREKIAIPTGIVLRVMADVCAGLHAAHELRDRDGRPASVVHRDVSPQNILISTDGISKIIDFGIAKALDRAGSDTTTGTLKGKIHYMAPEQARGHRIDRRADVWAVGAVLYNFFAGRPAYDGDSQLEMLHRLTSGVPPAPLPPKVPEPIARVIDGALRHDPNERWASTQHMQLCLERAMIEIGCPTTASGVAAFLGRHFADRAAARRRTIEAATIAVREQRVSAQAASQPIEFPSSAASSSGLLDVAARTPASLVTGAKVSSAAGLGGAKPAKEATSESLGSAAIDSPPPKRSSRRGAVIAVAAALGLIASAFVLVPRFAPSMSMTTAGTTAPPVAAAPPAPPPLPAASPPATGTTTETLLATSLPSAEPSGTVPATANPPVAHAAPAARPPAPKPSPPLPPKPAASVRKVIDDGF